VDAAALVAIAEVGEAPDVMLLIAALLVVKVASARAAPFGDADPLAAVKKPV